MEKIEDMATAIYLNMNRVLEDEEDRSPEIDKIDIGGKGSDANEFITAELAAFFIQFKNLTGSDIDLLDFIGILNKLAVQYIIDGNKEDK